MTRLVQRDHVRILGETAMSLTERIDGTKGGNSFRAGRSVATFRFQEGDHAKHPVMRIFVDRDDGYQIDLRIARPIDASAPTTPTSAAARLASVVDALGMRSDPLGSSDERQYRIALLLHCLLPDDLRPAKDDTLFINQGSPLGSVVMAPSHFPTDWRASAAISPLLPAARTTRATMEGIRNAATSWRVAGLPSRLLRALPSDPVTRLRAAEELMGRFGMSRETITTFTEANPS